MTQTTSPPLTASSHVVIFTGDLDIATAPALDDELGRMAAGQPARRLLVDLSGVTFMDCAGLRPLLAARSRPGAGMSLRNPAPPVLRLLRLLDLTAAFVIDATQATAAPAPPAPAQGRPPRQRLWRRRAHSRVPATPDQPRLVPHPSSATTAGTDPGTRFALSAIAGWSRPSQG